MTEPPVIDALDHLFAAVSASFVRYLVETSGAEARDDLDRTAVALYEEWRREEEKALGAIATRLAREGVFPASGSWPLEFSQFHYLSGTYLLRHVIRFTEPLLARIRPLGAALRGDPESAAIFDRLLSAEESYLEKAKALEVSRPKAAPHPPTIKGTSASRW